MVMNFIRKLMYGRYGSDQLSFFLLVVYIVLILLSGLPHLEALSWLAPAIRWLRMRRTIRRDKEHRYFKCPNCGQYLRVPRGKGKITVNCRNCGASFEERS